MAGRGRDPVVLEAPAVAAELDRLCAELREIRIAAGLSVRDAAAAAGLNHGTVYRLEHRRNDPTYLNFGALACWLSHRLELDDGRRRPRRLPSNAFPLPPGGYRFRQFTREQYPDGQVPPMHRWLHLQRSRIGGELWWARRCELDPALDGDDVCALLAMSHHTLAGVEAGVDWPALASVVRVAGLVGRRLVLRPLGDPLRLPPWPVELPDR